MANIYNQSTNLAAMGKFAPGVNYRADIKNPTQPVPSLPEVNESFNIDLSSIANAYADVKKTELALAQSEREMDQRLKIAEMENTRAYDIAEMNNRTSIFNNILERDTQWGIAKMNNEVEWFKALKDKEKKDKDLSQTYADNAFLKAMRDTAEDYMANPANREKFMLALYSNLDKVQADYPTANMTAVIEHFGRAYPGLATLPAAKMTEREKAISKKDTDMTLDLANNLPQTANMNAEDKYAYAKNWMSKTQEADRYLETITNPNTTPEDKEYARSQLKQYGMESAELTAYAYLYNQSQNIFKPGVNPFEVKEQIRAAYLENYAAKFTSPQDANNYFDSFWTSKGMDKSIENISKAAEGSSTYTKTMLDTQVTLAKKNIYATFPQMLTLSAMPAEVREAWLNNDKFPENMAMLEAMGNFLFGTTSIDGTEVSYYRNGKLIDTKPIEALDKLNKQLGNITGGNDALSYGTLFQISANMNKNRDTMPQGQTARANLGSIGVTLDGFSKALPKDKATMIANTAQAVEKGVIDVNNTKSWCETHNMQYGTTLCDSASAFYKLYKASNLDGGKAYEEFMQPVSYLTDMRNFPVLKDSTILLGKDKDGYPVLLREENGLLNSGFDEWNKRNEKFRNDLKRVGLNPKEATIVYLLEYPSIEMTSESIQKQYLDTIGKAGKADTSMLDTVANASKTNISEPIIDTGAELGLIRTGDPTKDKNHGEGVATAFIEGAEEAVTDVAKNTWEDVTDTWKDVTDLYKFITSLNPEKFKQWAIDKNLIKMKKGR